MMIETLYNHILEAINTALHNQLAQAGLVTVLFSGIVYKIRPIISSIIRFIRKRITSSVTYYSDKGSYDALVKYISPYIKLRHHTNISDIGEGTYFTFLNKRPTIITCRHEKLETYIYYTIHIESFFCSSLAQHIKSEVQKINQTGIWVSLESGFGSVNRLADFNNITLPTKNCKRLLQLIDAFYRSKIEKLGVILYGEPGNGKTQAILNVARTLKKNIRILSVGKNTTLRSIYNTVANATDCIVVLEDIDRLSLAQDSTKIKKDENTQSPVCDDFTITKADLLNALDGMLSGNGLLIATANHYDNIDPAILRKGRFDIHLEFTKPDVDDIISIHKSVYQSEPKPEFIEQNKGKTTAEIYNFIKMNMIKEITKESL